jgi:poly(3-hydroxyoctanoate) depolymerase
VIEGEFLRVDGVRLYVAQHGGGGRPLLLINGVGAHHAMWSVALEHLGDFSVIMADPPGIGRSPAVPFPLAIGDYAGLVADVVRKLGHEQVDVLGYSFGGAVAQELARRHPALVRRLALVGTSCGGGGIPGTAPALAMLFTPLRYHSPAFYNATAG